MNPLIHNFRVRGGRVKRRMQRARDGWTISSGKLSARSVEPNGHADESGAVTERLYAQLDSSDIAAINAAAQSEPVLTDALSVSTGVNLKRVELVSGVHCGIPSVLEKTGLTTEQPPDQVHSMSRDALSAGGSLYHADLVADELAAAGAPLTDGARLLDFGCSSGRVIRALHAAFPQVECFGCDPNGPAIEWADAKLPGIDFRRSENDPPSPYENDFFDAAFGISIWSHYNADLALRWYDEMWRVLKPGGHLISTTHGPQSIAFYGANGDRSMEELIVVKDALYRSGYWYKPEFGESGDWGVVNSDWGTSFVTADWILDRLTPKWQLASYSTARNENNQDVYVLKKP